LFPKKKEKSGKDGLKASIDPRYHSFQVVEAFWKNLGSREEETYATSYVHVLNWLSYWDMQVKASAS
jgi:hypothetical protein